MEQSQQNITPEIVQHYNKLKVEYSDLFRTTLDIEEEKREHILVIDSIKSLEPERKCWRLVGGVLVERSLAEVMTSLKENVEMLDKTSQNYTTSLKQKEKELIDYEIKYNLRPSRENTSGAKKEGDDKKKVTGLLA